jgi:hypothetical protein
VKCRSGQDSGDVIAQKHMEQLQLRKAFYFYNASDHDSTEYIIPPSPEADVRPRSQVKRLEHGLILI